MKFEGKFEVDTGGIVVMDFEQIPNSGGFIYGKKADEKCKRLEIESGRYEIKYHVPNGWFGPVKGTEIIDVNSGQLVVGDPGYFFSDCIDERFKWGYFLGLTHYVTYFGGTGFNINTGGDFLFDLELELKKI